MSQSLTAFGTIFSLVSAYFLYVAFGIETTVVQPGAVQGFDGVANLQLMHLQSLNLEIGIGAAIVAAIFFVGAAIVGAIGGRVWESQSRL